MGSASLYAWGQACGGAPAVTTIPPHIDERLMSIKKGEAFRIDQAWWKKGKPLTLKSTGLGKVMAEYQTNKAAAVKMAKAGHYDRIPDDANPLDLAEGILKTKLPTSVAKALKDCNSVLHKDVIECLRTAKKAIDAELKAVAQLRSGFNRLYQKKRAEMLNPARSVAAENTEAKGLAHEAYKNAESQLKELGDVAKKAARLSPEKAREAASDASMTVMSITSLQETIAEMAQAADTDFRKISGLVNDREMLTPTDSRELIKLVDTAQVARNAINTYRDKSALFITTAQTHLAAIEKVLPARGAPTAQDLLPRVKKLDANLTELCSRGREFNNTVVAFIQNLRLMSNKPDQASKMMRMPATEFPEYAQKAETDGPKFLDKIAKLKKQCDGMTKTVLHSVPKPLRSDPLLKNLISNIDRSIQNLKDLDEGGAMKKDEMNQLIKKIYVQAGW